MRQNVTVLEHLTTLARKSLVYIAGKIFELASTTASAISEIDTKVATLTKADVGLGQVDNTPDSQKSVASAATATKVGHNLTFAGAVTGSWNGSEAKTVTIPAIPGALKNPKALTFTGGSSAVYDGSAAQTVHIPNSAADVGALPVNGTAANASQLEGHPASYFETSLTPMEKYSGSQTGHINSIVKNGFAYIPSYEGNISPFGTHEQFIVQTILRPAGDIGYQIAYRVSGTAPEAAIRFKYSERWTSWEALKPGEANHAATADAIGGVDQSSIVKKKYGQSTESFSAIIGGYAGTALDRFASTMDSLSSGAGTIMQPSYSGPIYGITYMKESANFYCGIIFGYGEDLFTARFAYRNGLRIASVLNVRN